MKQIGLLIGFLAVLIVVLPSLTAQDAKKDAEKAAQKDEAKKDEKKDEAKKDEKKDPEKTDEKKEKKKEEPKKAEKEKLVYGTKFRTKILSATAENTRQFTVEVQEVDPKKVADVQNWQFQRQNALGQQLANIGNQKDFKQRINLMNTYQRDLMTFQNELANKNIYSPKSLDVRATEDAKVRTLRLPVEFDDQGFQKKWTKKEIEERKDKTGLPGFPADFDAIKSGQYVDLYMAKVAPATKKKKGPDDEAPVVSDRKEFVMVVIVAEPAAK